MLEEQYRLGAALWQYCTDLHRSEARPANVYTLGDAAGVTARALAQVGEGCIRTLTCSPTNANRDQFFSLGAPEQAAFFLGPFFRVTPASLRNAGIEGFEKNFDIIIEDTTFQMYGLERYEPIALACRNLRPGGIFMLIEKVRHPDADEYVKRERQKDGDFKSRFFDLSQISEKRSGILDHMQEMEASLDDLTGALKRHFSSAVITWNSGNFYTIAASTKIPNLVKFINGMLPPAIPDNYCYEQLPAVLFGTIPDALIFRTAESEPFIATNDHAIVAT